MFNNIVIVSGVQQNNSVIHIYETILVVVSIDFLIGFCSLCIKEPCRIKIILSFNRECLTFYVLGTNERRSLSP